jgi:Fe-S cluster assembly protein SufD
MMDLAKVQQTYLTAFKPASSGPSGPAWLSALREKAFGHFSRTGFPTPKNERWKYTDLSLYLTADLKKETPVTPATKILAKMKSLGYDVEKDHWLVFIDGIYSHEQSSLQPLEVGFELGNLATKLNDPKVEAILGQIASFESDAFTALNLAAFQDGLWVSVPENRVVSHVVHAVFVSMGAQPSYVRNLVLSGANSQIAVVEHFLEEAVGASLASAVTEIKLATGATLSHVKIQNESEKNLHLGSVKSRQEAGSHFTSRVFSFGGKLVRNETETLLADRRSEAVLEGLFMGRHHHHVDNQTFIDHAAPNCSCQETYKGVLEAEATGIFDGRVLVRENAQKTDARQSNKNLLLSKTAKVYSKPQLQIYADDVKCSHGSATGQLDEEALFYLRARGIGKEEARRILVSAFCGELVERVEPATLREPLRKAFQLWLKTAPGREGSRES